jgi:hypothetical protein
MVLSYYIEEVSQAIIVNRLTLVETAQTPIESSA